LSSATPAKVPPEAAENTFAVLDPNRPAPVCPDIVCSGTGSAGFAASLFAADAGAGVNEKEGLAVAAGTVAAELSAPAN